MLDRIENKVFENISSDFVLKRRKKKAILTFLCLDFMKTNYPIYNLQI